MSDKTNSNVLITSAQRPQGIQLVYANGQVLPRDNVHRAQLPPKRRARAFDFIITGFALAGASYYATPDYPPRSAATGTIQTLPGRLPKTGERLGAAIWKALLRMIARGRERRAAEDARRYLLAREDYLLRDIGLTRWDLQAGWPRGGRET
jgi:uncharacterized protein YjiS (DUF1127 family)